MDAQSLQKLAKLVRYYILISTSKAGSGHPTSSLSATDLMATLLFGGAFHADLSNPEYPNNDRLIFSKGHAAPLLYALYAAAGAVSEEELLTLRTFGSRLEGHPARVFPYTEVPTGSLGQGLSVGAGMALNAKLNKLVYRTYVLLGDSEMAEGSVWEALQIASYYKLDNLVGILDVNRLGQRGETMYGHDCAAFERRIAVFGWNTLVIDGHSLEEITKAYQAAASSDCPTMVIAKTLKGKGVSFIEDKDGWHGKALGKEDLERALKELGDVDHTVRGTMSAPERIELQRTSVLPVPEPSYDLGSMVSTRKAYGNALVRLFPKFPDMVVLDAEVGNSTYAENFKKAHPERFFEMFIAEQNMVGVAMGLARRGKLPFVSTFAAFFTRAFDQIRMSQYAGVGIKFAGSHAGVAIGEDGASQMALEDIAMFRALLGSTVLYPSDAASSEKLTEEAAQCPGIVYIRTSRNDLPVLYDARETFPIGGSKILRQSEKDVVAVISAGVTLHEALAAQEELSKEGIAVRIIDLYSIKPVDEKTLKNTARSVKAIVVVEDHFAEGGIADAVRSALASLDASRSGLSENLSVPIHSLAVRKIPKSAGSKELLDYEEISKSAIISKIKELAVRI